MPANESTCPYLDKECPKVVNIDEQVKLNATKLATVERLLYIIVGMIAIEYGLVLF